MPLYFAYGSNMDVEAMRTRCPRSQALGRARLMRFSFALMSEGYATIVNNPRGVVHGVLWDLALSDVRALDAYEGAGRGLYKKIVQPVFRDGAASSRALLYVGRAGAPGKPQRGYMEGVIAAAREWALPQAYLRELEGLCAGPARVAGAAVASVSASRAPEVAERDAAGNIKVRPRFASPLDRSKP